MLTVNHILEFNITMILLSMPKVLELEQQIRKVNLNTSNLAIH